MRNTQESARTFSRLLRRLKPSRSVPQEKGDALEVLVRSFLIWDSTTTKAHAAYKRITDQIVDFNDLRVSMPHEIVAWIGPRYPMALERCQRLRAALRHTYKREHAVNLQRLDGMGRREVKQYLRSLDGIALYVADRVTLLCYDAHCIPVDERLRRALIKVGVCDEQMNVADLSSWLARQVKASDAAGTHYALQAWVDRVGGSFAQAKPARGAPRSKTTSPRRKKTARAR